MADEKPSVVVMQTKHWYQSGIIWLSAFVAAESLADGIQRLQETGKIDVSSVLRLVASVAAGFVRSRMADVNAPGSRGAAN